MAASTLTLEKLQSEMRDFVSSQKSRPDYVPDYALPVSQKGFVQVPAYGTQALIVRYQVKANWRCLMRGIVLGFQGSGTAPNPGDANFSIDIDRPLGGDSGYFEKDFGIVPFPLGTFVGGPTWPVMFRHRDTEIIRIKATAVANMGTGPGNFFVAALVGWEWPEEQTDA